MTAELASDIRLKYTEWKRKELTLLLSQNISGETVEWKRISINYIRTGKGKIPSYNLKSPRLHSISIIPIRCRCEYQNVNKRLNFNIIAPTQ